MKTQTLSIVFTVMLVAMSVLYGQNPDKQSYRSSGRQLISEPETEHINAATSGGNYRQKALPGEAASAYLTSGFIVGEVIMANGAVIDNMPLRYNLYTQQMQYIDGDDTLAIGNPQEIEYLVAGGKTFVYVAYKCNDEIKTGYFELLEDGECRLLKRWFARYQVKDQTTRNTDDCGVFYRDCNCFLQFGDRPAEVVSRKKKHFVDSFGDQEEKIQEIMRLEKLKNNREDDLRKIVAFYNLHF
jgi:hypothetical protein